MASNIPVIEQWANSVQGYAEQMNNRADQALQTADAIINQLAADPVDVGGPDALPQAPVIVIPVEPIDVPALAERAIPDVHGFEMPARAPDAEVTTYLSGDFSFVMPTPGTVDTPPLGGLAPLVPVGKDAPVDISVVEGVAGFTAPAFDDGSGLVGDLVADAVPVFQPAALGDLTAAVTVPEYAPRVVSADFGDQDVPTFSSAVSFVMPSVPDGIDLGTRPTRPETDPIELPAAPNYTEPTLPSLTPIVVPSYDFNGLPTFDAAAPEFTESPPAVGLAFAPGEYQSSLLESVRGRLSVMFSDGTGLPPAVEAALFDRARAREDTVALKASQEAVDTWAGMGFSMPPGMLVEAELAVTAENRLKLAAVNRDVYAEALQREIETARFAVEKAVTLEIGLMDHFYRMAGLALDAAKAEVEFEIQIYNSAVTLFNAKQQAYQVAGEIFKISTEARLAVIRANLEAAQLTGQLNEQQVRIYVEEWEARAKQVAIYREMMAAQQTVAGIIQAKFAAWASDMEGWKAEIDAQKIAKYDTYELVMRGEGIKGGVLSAEAQAYTAAVGGIKANAELKVERVRAETAVLGAETEAYGARISGVKAQADIRIQSAQNQIAGLNAETGAYTAAVGGYRAMSEISIQNAQTRIAGLEAGVKRFQALLESERARMESQSGLGVKQVEARIAALRAVVDTYTADTGAAVQVFGANTDLALKQAEMTISGFQAGTSRFTASADAEVKRIDALLAQATGRTQASIAGYQAVTARFVGEVEAQKAWTESDAERVRGQAALLGTDVARFQAIAEHNRGVASLGVSAAEATGRLQASVYDVEARQYDAMRERLIKKAEMLKTATQSAGSMASQLAAGAMSALHIGGSIQADGRYSNDYNYNDSHHWQHGQV